MYVFIRIVGTRLLLFDYSNFRNLWTKFQFMLQEDIQYVVYRVFPMFKHVRSFKITSPPTLTFPATIDILKVVKLLKDMNEYDRYIFIPSLHRI